MIINMVGGGGDTVKVYPDAISISPSASEHVVTAPSGYDAMKKVRVAGDPDLKSSNIKNGVNIFGVVGSLMPESELMTRNIPKIKIGSHHYQSSTIKTTYDYCSSYSSGYTFYTDTQAMVRGTRGRIKSSSQSQTMYYLTSDWKYADNFMAAAIPWTTGTVSGSVKGILKDEGGYDEVLYDATFEGPVDNITVTRNTSQKSFPSYNSDWGTKAVYLYITELDIRRTP